MKKRVGLLVVIVGLMGLNMYLFSLQNSISPLEFSLSGNAITNINQIVPEGMSLSIFIFICQWVLILIIAFFAYIRYLRKRRREAKIAKISTAMPQKKTSETDFDLLYKYLKEKEKLSTKTISKIFKIPKDRALEWSKILESNELVTIEYPAFSDPEVIIKKEEDKTEEGDSKDNQKKEDKKGKEKEEKKDNEEHHKHKKKKHHKHHKKHGGNKK